MTGADTPSAVAQAEIDRLHQQVADLQAQLQARRPSETLFPAVQEIACVGGFRLDVATQQLDWTDQEYRLLGYEPGQVVPTFELVAERVHPEDRDRFLAAHRDLIDHHRPYNNEFRFIHPSGAVRDLHVRALVDCDEQGHPKALYGATVDITERRAAERALREREALLNAVGRMAKVGGWEVDAATLAVSWTDETYRIHDVPIGEMPSLEEAIGFFHPDDRGRLMDAIRLALEDGTPYDLHLQFITAKGHHLWTRTICQPEVRDGRTVRLLGTFQDITACKCAELAVRNSEERLRSYIEHSPYAIFVLDDDGRFLDANPAACAVTGYSADQLVKLGVGDLAIPEEREAANATLAQLRATGSMTGERRIRRRDGAVALIAFQAARLPGKQYISFGQDITAARAAQHALQRQQARLASLFRAAPVGIGVLVERHFTEVNDRFCEMVGYAADELLGQSSRLICSGDAEHDHVGRELHAQIARLGVGTVETRFQRKDGRVIDILLSATPVDPDDPTAGRTFTALDITQRKQAEAQLAEHRDHLEELVRARTEALEASQAQLRRSERLASVGTFASGIAHEINNPMGAILLAAQTALSHSEMPPVVAAELEEIVGQARRCGRIVRDLLEFARHGTTVKRADDLNQALEHAVSLLHKYAEQERASVELALTADLPPLWLNRTEIEQVVVNLVQNAVQARATRVTVRSLADAGAILLQVDDDGSGIEPEVLSHLFDPFFSTRCDTGGTGLGLSIAHSIVRDHGATIDVQSTLGHGTSFTVRFPRSQQLPLRETPSWPAC